MSTPASGMALRISRQASMPPMSSGPPRRTSISTTSGRRTSALSMASLGAGRFAHHLQVGLHAEDGPQAGPHHLVVVHQQDAQRHRSSLNPSGW